MLEQSCYPLLATGWANFLVSPQCFCNVTERLEQQQMDVSDESDGSSALMTHLIGEKNTHN